MLQAALLLTARSKADVAFIVIGGMAAVAQGATYVTADLDLCYQRHPQNYQRLSQALHPFNPRLRGAPADLPFVLDAATLRAGFNFTLMTDVGDEETGLVRPRLVATQLPRSGCWRGSPPAFGSYTLIFTFFAAGYALSAV